MNSWSKTYPILKKYKSEVDIPHFAERIRSVLDELGERYGYDELDSMIVLKDILFNEYKQRK